MQVFPWTRQGNRLRNRMSLSEYLRGRQNLQHALPLTKLPCSCKGTSKSLPPRGKVAAQLTDEDMSGARPGRATRRLRVPRCGRQLPTCKAILPVQYLSILHTLLYPVLCAAYNLIRRCAPPSPQSPGGCPGRTPDISPRLTIKSQVLEGGNRKKIFASHRRL